MSEVLLRFKFKAQPAKSAGSLLSSCFMSKKNATILLLLHFLRNACIMCIFYFVFFSFLFSLTKRAFCILPTIEASVFFFRNSGTVRVVPGKINHQQKRGGYDNTLDAIFSPLLFLFIISLCSPSPSCFSLTMIFSFFLRKKSQCIACVSSL